MVGQIPALHLLVANLAADLHRSAYLGTLLSTAPRHATVDGVQGGNPIGLSLAQLGKVVLILLEELDLGTRAQHIKARHKAVRAAGMAPHVAVMDTKATRKSKTSGAHVDLRTARGRYLIYPPGEKHGEGWRRIESER
jgi:hypothetical protein